ncbi:MAG TPA: hypothetical protein VMU47_05300 [Caldimonas sp.]|nr:hypothetical protein [Caldimonas sp.]
MATREPATGTGPADAARDTAHPAPHRDRVPGWLITVGLFGAPAAWSVQSLLDVGLSGYACYPKDEPLATPIWSGLSIALAGANVVALLVCVIAGVVAFVAYRRSGAERPGSAHHLLESGDGRTRFLALAGVLTSVLFVVAVAFETVQAIVGLPCHG